MSKEKLEYEAPVGPVTKAVGIYKTKNGWRAAFMKVQGRTVLSYSNLCDDCSKSEAIEYLKLAVVRKIMPSDF